MGTIYCMLARPVIVSHGCAGSLLQVKQSSPAVDSGMGQVGCWSCPGCARLLHGQCSTSIRLTAACFVQCQWSHVQRTCLIKSLV
jgi:hypothetical protein